MSLRLGGICNAGIWGKLSSWFLSFSSITTVASQSVGNLLPQFSASKDVRCRYENQIGHAFNDSMSTGISRTQRSDEVLGQKKERSVKFKNG